MFEVVAFLLFLSLIGLLLFAWYARKSPNRSRSRTTAIRGGRSIDLDDVGDVWREGNLKDMLAVLDKPANPIDRHFLLQRIVKETYGDRQDPKKRQICRKVAEIHLSEMNEILPVLKEDFGGSLPRIATFQHYATVLTEDGEYDAAVEVCEAALSYGLDDGTKTGFEGRIKRILRKKEKAE